MTNTQNWQPLAAQDLDREQPPHLRMSSAGRCPRALAYATMHLEESDPPDEHSLNRMAMGHMAEVLIVRGMHRRGWETGHTVLSDSGQLELEVAVPNTGMVMREHPDGICRHPEFTRNHWVTLECKSMSIEKGREVERQGVAPTYPHYIFQISMYGRRMHEMELVSHPERGVFAMMDRDGRPLPPERVSWDAGLVDGKLAELTGVVRAAEAGEVPERPYPQSSSECQYCNYHTLCWGGAAPAGRGQPQASDRFGEPRGAGRGRTVGRVQAAGGHRPGLPAGRVQQQRPGRHHGCRGDWRILRTEGTPVLRCSHPGAPGAGRHPQEVPEPEPAAEAGPILGAEGQDLTGVTGHPAHAVRSE